MNNFELHEKAELLTVTMSSYRLARELLEYQERHSGTVMNLQRVMSKLEMCQEELAEYQRIYGSLDQGDYLRR